MCNSVFNGNSQRDRFRSLGRKDYLNFEIRWQQMWKLWPPDACVMDEAKLIACSRDSPDLLLSLLLRRGLDVAIWCKR
jgi:hypothetical protein